MEKSKSNFIVSENERADLRDFKDLMSRTDSFLNKNAIGKESYYRKRNSQLLEEDVLEALLETSKGTCFEGTIQLVSGKYFPDIIAAKYYGIEVKSTAKNHWTSIGSSILESTRKEDVERIYMTFGKLGGTPIEFISRPYEECLSDIVVTHYPRYKIDMRLKKGESIFDKMAISYDELRQEQDLVPIVSEYYKERLKPGEKLWWATETLSPPILRLWSGLPKKEKNLFIAQGLALFPEIIAGNYDRFLFYLIEEHSIVNHCVRDSFSAGGKYKSIYPAVFKRIAEHSDKIIKVINETNVEILKKSWKVNKVEKDRVLQWKKIIEEIAKRKDMKFLIEI